MTREVNICIIITLTLGSICVYGPRVAGNAEDAARIPNGTVFDCDTCHSDGNQFITDYAQAGRTWNIGLVMQDSDGDGFTKGEELQDPEGSWHSGLPDPGNADLVSNPGDSTSVPGPTTPTLTPTLTRTPTPEIPSPTPTPPPTYTQLATFTPQPTPTPEPTGTNPPTYTPEATHTPYPTYTQRPTGTPPDTFTPHPTFTPYPTETPHYTPTPRPTSPPEPTATPYPTQTPFPTQTPLSTYTPYPTVTRSPAPTATATPGSCTETGVFIDMPSDMFQPGDLFYCKLQVCNAENSSLDGYPVFVLLEVLGSYFFAPSFNTVYDNYLVDYPFLEPGLNVIEVIPNFYWPEGAGDGNNVRFLAAITDAEVTKIIGKWDTREFGWSQ